MLRSEQSAVRQTGRIRCAACGAATIDPWPSDEELSGAYGAWYRPESGRRFGVLGDELLRRTRGSLAARLDAIAPPGPVLDVGAGDGTLIDALAGAAARPPGSSARPPARTFATSRSRRWTASGRRSCSGTRSSICPRRGRRSATRRACSRPAASWSWRCPTAGACRRGRSAIAGCTWTGRGIWSISPRARSTSGLERHGLSVERVSSVRGGQVVIGWLDGLVGSLPGGLNLYQALRRPEARSVPLDRGRWAASLGRRRRPAAGRGARRRRRGRAATLGHDLRGGAPGQRRGASATTVKSPGPRATVRSRKRRSIRCSAHFCSGARRAGRGEDVARRVRPQRGEHLRGPAGRGASGRRGAAHRPRRGAGAAPPPRRSSPPTDRPGAACPRGRCGAGSRCRGRAGPSRGSLARPACERRSACCAGRGPGRQRRRVPEALERPAQRAAARRGVRERRAREAGVDRVPGRPRRRARRRRAQSARPAVRGAAPDRGPAAQQQAQPEGAGEQHRQRDVDEDVVQASGRRSSSSARCHRR